MATRSNKLAMIGLSLADLIFEVFCFAATPSFRGVTTIVSKARQAVKDASSSSAELARDRSDLGKRVTDALTTKVKAAREQSLDRGIDTSLLTQAETAVAALLSTDADQDLTVLSAVRDPEGFVAFFMTHAAKHRQQIDEQAEPYFDVLVRAVAAAYVDIAPWSDSFVIVALKSLLTECSDIKEQLNDNQIENRQLLSQILEVVESLAAAINELAQRNLSSTPSRVFFSSRPDVVVGDRFIERREQEQLNSLIADPTRHRTVLWGMRGCGKTQLAASLAKQCEDANWNLVAWINAVSPDTIQSDLVELAERLKIDTSDQPAQDVIIRRCLDHLKSADPADRLIVFDNVEDINDLRGFIPTGDGLRVVATTTNNTGWEHQDWNRIKVGEFDRRESIDYLLTVTNSDDREAADALADRLGDLPLALAQAAASARNGNLSLVRYLDRLDSYGSERVIRPVPGGYYTDDVATALCIAIEDALENLADPTRRSARRQLGALALLAESGVPTRWLDPTIEQLYGDDSPGTHRDSDEDAHDALTELIHRSIVQQSADGSTTMLHRLQAEVLRESWTNDEHDEAHAAATDLLGSVNIGKYPRNDTKARRQEALDLVGQLRSIGTQEHSRTLFEYPQITESLSHAFSHAIDLGLPYEALTLAVAVDALEVLLGPDHPDALASRNNLAGTYESVGRLIEAIALFERVLADSIRVLGEDHPNTLASRNNLAHAYHAGGRFTEAIALFERVLADSIRVLGEDHPSTLTSRDNLAGACKSEGRLTEAIALYEQVLPDRSRVLGEDHPDTLASRNNLAGAYRERGRLTEAIALFERVLADSIRVLGEDHPNTLASHNNLAHVYQATGHLNEAITLLEQSLQDSTRILGEDDPQTTSVRNDLADAYRWANRTNDAITLFKQAVDDRIHALGEDHPRTLSAFNDLARAYRAAGRLTEAITLYEQVLTDRIRVLGEDHPLTKTVRENLEVARRELAQREDNSPTEQSAQAD